MSPLAWEASLPTCEKAPEEPSSHDQKDLPKEEDMLAFINMSMVNTSIVSSLGPTLTTIDANESQKVNEEL